MKCAAHLNLLYGSSTKMLNSGPLRRCSNNVGLQVFIQMWAAVIRMKDLPISHLNGFSKNRGTVDWHWMRAWCPLILKQKKPVSYIIRAADFLKYCLLT